MMKRLCKLKFNKKTVTLITAGAILIAAFVGLKVHNNKKTAMSDVIIRNDIVTRGNLEVSITGEASVQPYERFEIISMVSGDIISSPYDVGDSVQEGAVLYQFDTKDAQTGLQKQEISLQQSRNNLANAKSDLADAIDDLNIKAENSGIISGLTIKKGNDISQNQTIAQIVNTKDLEVSLPFTGAQVSQMYVGQTATVSSSVHMSSVDGKIESISSEAMAQDDGSVVYSVKISFENPGSFTEGLIVGGEVSAMASPGYGTVKYTESSTLKSKASGTVTAVNYADGDYVTKGAVIATLSSDSLSAQKRSITNSELSLKNAELSMQETRDGLDDYSITSPISGTVITKNAKAGDTIDRTNSQTALMVVADISKLKFSMEIDELDVASVKTGQRVSITCDALPKEQFEGEITSISVEGTATNGVTTYTAEVVINNPGNLRPSMNIDASVIIDSASDVLMVPVADVKTAMGVSYVFLADKTGERGATEEDFQKAMMSGFKDVTPSQKSSVTTPSKMPFNAPDSSKTKKNNSDKKQQKQSKLPEVPEGYVIAIVQTGISNDDYIEIKSGLLEGDEIQQISTSSSSNSFFSMMGSMHSGMSGGGMPGGGMPGGNRMGAR